jgi:predicted nucleic acid-binding protein
MRIALDTNILVSMEGGHGPDRHAKIEAILQSLDADAIILPVQSIIEMAFVLKRRGGLSKVVIAACVTRWMNAYTTADNTQSALREAAALSAIHEFRIFDAIVVAVAVEAGCSLLLSEDMHDGFTWRGCTIVNPLAATPNPLLLSVFRSPPNPTTSS